MRYPKKPLPPRQQRESPPAGLLDRTSSCLKAARLNPCPLTPRGAAAFAGPPISEAEGYLSPRGEAAYDKHVGEM